MADFILPIACIILYFVLFLFCQFVALVSFVLINFENNNYDLIILLPFCEFGLLGLPSFWVIYVVREENSNKQYNSIIVHAFGKQYSNVVDLKVAILTAWAKKCVKNCLTP